MVNIRLLPLSISEDEFNKATPLYERALRSSDFNKNLKFESIQEKSSPHRKRKVVWFNPRYNAEVKTNIGKIFLKLVRKHFHKRHCCKKMFNTNTIKLSYSCTPNDKNLIKQHNISIMKAVTNANKKDCYRRNKDNCPLDGKSLVLSIYLSIYPSTYLSI